MRGTCSLCSSSSNWTFGPSKVPENDNGYVELQYMLYCLRTSLLSGSIVCRFLTFIVSVVLKFMVYILQMSVAEAREACQNWWMREALEKLVCRQMHPQQKEEAEEETKCTQNSIALESVFFFSNFGGPNGCRQGEFVVLFVQRKLRLGMRKSNRTFILRCLWPSQNHSWGCSSCFVPAIVPSRVNSSPKRELIARLYNVVEDLRDKTTCTCTNSILSIQFQLIHSFLCELVPSVFEYKL